MDDTTSLAPTTTDTRRGRRRRAQPSATRCRSIGDAARLPEIWCVFRTTALTARPGPFRAFYRSSGGVVTLLFAAALTALGVVVLGRLGREQEEERVFS